MPGRLALTRTQWVKSTGSHEFVTTELNVFDEKELGAGTFVLAKIKRQT